MKIKNQKLNIQGQANFLDEQNEKNEQVYIEGIKNKITEILIEYNYFKNETNKMISKVKQVKSKDKLLGIFKLLEKDINVSDAYRRKLVSSVLNNVDDNTFESFDINLDDLLNDTSPNKDDKVVIRIEKSIKEELILILKNNNTNPSDYLRKVILETIKNKKLLEFESMDSFKSRLDEMEKDIRNIKDYLNSQSLRNNKE